jgi:hypothetical protein
LSGRAEETIRNDIRYRGPSPRIAHRRRPCRNDRLAHAAAPSRIPGENKPAAGQLPLAGRAGFGFLARRDVALDPDSEIATDTFTMVNDMHPLRPASSPLQRLQAKATLKPVNFIHLAPQAKEVFLIGDFNDWNPASHPMKKSYDGSFALSVTLGHGGHHYQFLVDGKRVNDPRAQGLARNESGEKVSLILVS